MNAFQFGQMVKQALDPFANKPTAHYSNMPALGTTKGVAEDPGTAWMSVPPRGTLKGPSYNLNQRTTPPMLQDGATPGAADPQMQSLIAGTEQAAEKAPPPLTQRYPTPYPIRGAGRMGSIPSLNLNELQGMLRAQ